jgi:PD-(D/E)XK nuclease family transposase
LRRFICQIFKNMKERTFISFDWAIKKILRHKKNFTVLEGFLSELLGFNLTIENLLESEGNKQHESDKYDRVDILVKTDSEELVLIEVQYDDEDDYFHRMVYGISKLITEYIAEGQRYGSIKKAYSINIMYFRLGQGKDYIYEYEGNFIGRRRKDVLNPTKNQKNKYGIQTVADIFPKYYILRVGSFKEEVIDPIDEWMYFLKNSKIKDNFKAKGMKEAQIVLQYENMSDEDKRAYRRHIENRRVEMAVVDTAIDKAKRQLSIDFARKSLKKGINIDDIIDMTGLPIDEIITLSRGGELDKEDDN